MISRILFDYIEYLIEIGKKEPWELLSDVNAKCLLGPRE